jgi:hypothetical protein
MFFRFALAVGHCVTMSALRTSAFLDFDVEPLSHGTARRHTDAVDVVLSGASDEAHGCQDNCMVSTRRMPPCPRITGA